MIPAHDVSDVRQVGDGEEKVGGVKEGDRGGMEDGGWTAVTTSIPPLSPPPHFPLCLKHTRRAQSNCELELRRMRRRIERGKRTRDVTKTGQENVDCLSAQAPLFII